MMLKRDPQNEEAKILFLPCATPGEAMDAGRAAAEYWRGKPVALAREQGPWSGLLSLAAVAGLMAGGAQALDHGVRARGEFHSIRDPRSPVGFFFRESPKPALEVYASGGCPLEEGARYRMAALSRAGEGGLPARHTPGNWLRMDGGREEYFRRLTGLVPQGLEGFCCRFQCPDREAQLLGNQALSVLGVRPSGRNVLTLDRLGRLVSLRLEGGLSLEGKEIGSILDREQEDGGIARPRTRRAGWDWSQDGLMAGLLLLNLLSRRDGPEEGWNESLRSCREELRLGIPVVRLPTPQDFT